MLFTLARSAEDKRLDDIARHHFHSADNLTDQLSALMAVNMRPSAVREELMQAFL